MMQQIGQLNEKLDLLLRKYKACKEENLLLKKKISEQEISLGILNKQVSDLRQKNDLEKIAAGLESREAKQKMVQQINQVIDEIDQLLNNLNEE